MTVFETNIMPILERRDGIDTMYHEFFHGSFDTTSRYQSMTHPRMPNVQLLKLHFDDIGRWESIIQTALHTKIKIPIALENRSIDKAYKDDYIRWRAQFRIRSPSTLLTLTLDPIFAKYHSKHDAIVYANKWFGPIMEMPRLRRSSVKETNASHGCDSAAHDRRGNVVSEGPAWRSSWESCPAWQSAGVCKIDAQH